MRLFFDRHHTPKFARAINLVIDRCKIQFQEPRVSVHLFCSRTLSKGAIPRKRLNSTSSNQSTTVKAHAFTLPVGCPSKWIPPSWLNYLQHQPPHRSYSVTILSISQGNPSRRPVVVNTTPCATPNLTRYFDSCLLFRLNDLIVRVLVCFFLYLLVSVVFLATELNREKKNLFFRRSSSNNLRSLALLFRVARNCFGSVNVARAHFWRRVAQNRTCMEISIFRTRNLRFVGHPLRCTLIWSQKFTSLVLCTTNNILNLESKLLSLQNSSSLKIEELTSPFYKWPFFHHSFK